MGINTQDTAIDILFRKFYDDEAKNFYGSEKTAYAILSKFIIDTFSDENNTIVEFPYDKLTNYVYKSSEIESEDNEYLLNNINFLKQYCSEEDKEIIQLFCQKFMNHYRLSKIQKDFMENVTKKAVSTSEEALNISNKASDLSKKINESAKETKNLIAETKDTVKDVTNKINKIEEVKGTIYTEFIAILGIFSALIFGLFGGFQGLSEAIVKLSTDWSVGRVLIIGSGIMMCLTLLIFGLLQWVARITGRKLTSCDCYENKEECQHSLFRRHRTLFSLVLSFIFIFVLGEYIETFETYSNISETWMFIPLAWLIPVILSLIVLIVIWNVFDLKKWKSEWKSKKNK